MSAPSHNAHEPLSIGGLTTLQMVYEFDPMPAAFRVTATGVQFPEQQPVQNETDISVPGQSATVAMIDVAPGAIIHYTVDGSLPTQSSPVYTTPLTLALSVNHSINVSAIAILQDGRTSAPSFLHIESAGGI